MTLLRRYIIEALHGAGDDFMRKESIKDVIQHALIERIASGEVAEQADVDEFFATIDMAAKTLRMIPFEVLYTAAGKMPTAARRKDTSVRRVKNRV